MPNASRTIAALIMGCAIASVACADTVDVKFTGTGLGRNVQLTYGARTFNVFAGQLKHTFTNGTGDLGSEISGNLLTFCTDLSQYVTSSTATYNVVSVQTVPGSPGMGRAKATLIRNLYSFARDAQFSTASTDAAKDFAAAFQLAVWEIVYDYAGSRSTLDLTTGLVMAKQTNGAALTLGVRTNLTNFFNASMVDGAYKQVVAVSSGRFQDQLVQTDHMVPLPGAAAMGGLGLFAVAGRRRRR